MASSKTLLKAALLVGTFDIIGASIQFYLQTGKSPFKPVLTFIASGLFGKGAGFNEETMMVAGLLLHYLIATAFTIFFFFTLARYSITRNQPLLIGILYGMFVWAVMNLLVLPITNTRPFVFDPAKNAIAMGILIACIGIPLPFLASSPARKWLPFKLSAKTFELRMCTHRNKT